MSALTAIPTHPELFRPELEIIAEDEAQTEQDLTKAILSIARKVYEDSGHAMRSVHAKSHGLLKADVEVLDGLPEVLAQGLFAKAGHFEALMRFSTTPGDMLPDKVSTPRGVAEGDQDQDFIMVNGKTFTAPDARSFLRSLKLLAVTTDRIEGVKVAVSGALRAVERLAEKAGHPSGMVKSAA